MFTRFFFLLRAYGVPVTVTEWMMLMRALSEGLALSSLDRFYSLARSILVKSETLLRPVRPGLRGLLRGHRDARRRSPTRSGTGSPTRSPAGPDRRREAPAGASCSTVSISTSSQRLFEERLAEQTEAHHGGNRWVGTGGTSPFGHSGVHPGGIRVGGESRGRSAVKVAGERRYRGYRTDVKVGVRQFELALRRLRQLSSRNEGPADELDLDATVDETAEQAGRLSLVWQKSRKNAVKVLLAMDVGGSMHPYLRLCSQLFSAVNSQTHFKDLKTYYFHNCIYDWLYLDTDMTRHNAVPTSRVLHDLAPDYKLIVVGDAAMAPSELLSRHGIIWWGYSNEEPGIEWLRRLRRHFDHSVWLNTIPRDQWEWAYGARTIGMIRQVLPMEELSLDGLQAAVKKLMVAR